MLAEFVTGKELSCRDNCILYHYSIRRQSYSRRRKVQHNIDVQSPKRRSHGSRLLAFWTMTAGMTLVLAVRLAVKYDFDRAKSHEQKGDTV